MATVNKVQIKYTAGGSSCDDCGFYSWDRLEIIDAESTKTVLYLHGDSHLSGGEVEHYSPAELARLVLKAVGIEVVSVKETREDDRY